MILKKILFTVFIFFISINLLLGFLGISSLGLALSMYFIKWWVLRNSILYFFKNHSELKEYLIALNVSIISLFFVELSLKYIAKHNLSYTESNGSFFYHSPYQQPHLENLWNKYINKTEGIFLNTAMPYSTDLNKKSEFSYLHTYNSLGLRGIEPIKDSSIYTVLGLGDSFTEGVGAPQDSSWTVLLETFLVENLELNLQVINAGVGGSDPVDQLFLLENKLLEYAPNLVILAIDISDISDIIIRGGKERWDGNKLVYPTGPWWEFFYSYSHIVRTLTHSFFQLNALLISDDKYEEKYKEAKLTIRDIIENDFMNLSSKHGFQLVLVFNTGLNELKKNNSEFCDEHEYFSSLESVKSISLLEAYNELLKNKKADIDSFYWKLDGHHNSQGYLLWAESIQNDILEVIKKDLLSVE